MNNVNYNREDIIKRLILLDKKLSSQFDVRKNKFKLIIIGGAALMLKYDLDRPTDDIDSLKIEKRLRIFLEKDYDLFRINDKCRGVIMIHYDYEDRLSKLPDVGYTFRFLDIFTLSDYDLIITKFGRGDTKDIRDIVTSGILDNINKERLDKLMKEAILYYPVAPKRKERDWEFFKRDYF